ncbi:MAG: Acyl-[acyl-carrier-protein]--UDP-N-acetylglucosamine O-acyltransferase [Acidobacteria bacterium]|nr:Acyl-[acyl-carrier-protein]--UDP-N-acetylglucosamine O-acyltransferase [Acidobacteriota bacterium]
MLNIPILLDRLCYRQPSFLVDAITEHDAGRRLVAVKNVTVNEEFFQGHFPGAPVLPGVMMLESLSQVAAMLLLHRDNAAPTSRVYLRGINDAKFRRQVFPGDQLRLEVTLGRRRTTLARAQAAAIVGDQVVAEAELLLGVVADETQIHPSAIVHPGAQIGRGTTIGPHASIGPDVRIGRNCRIGASAVVDGWTEVGDDTEIYPFGSIGLAPQDLKYEGEPTRLVIGRRNIFREFVTINRGTRGGGGVTTIGDHNVFMAYVHVAHDALVGDHTIFGPHATLGGHVAVESYANISAGSAVHQFCRVGRHGFIGGYSVITKDALPFARTVGSRPARIFGANTIGLMRRGFTAEVVAKLKRSFRYLLQSKLNTTRALQQIEQDQSLSCPEVLYLIDFIRSSQRGVILRRPSRRAEEVVADE